MKKIFDDPIQCWAIFVIVLTGVVLIMAKIW